MKLYGKNPVIERLKANPRSIIRIYIQTGKSDISYIRNKARKCNIPIIFVPQTKIDKIGRNINTQGIIAEIEGFSYTEYDDLLNNASEDKKSIVFLDSINDPQNLGAIIRSLACLGGFSIVLPSKDSAGVTEAVLRIASGGDNYVQVAQVRNLSQAILAAKEKGFWIAGTVVENGKDLISTKLPMPISLVVGSEQKGIRDGIRKHLDLILTMPMTDAQLSFNVAQATTIFCYEIIRQKALCATPQTQ